MDKQCTQRRSLAQQIVQTVWAWDTLPHHHPDKNSVSAIPNCRLSSGSVEIILVLTYSAHSLKTLRGRQLTEVLVAFLEATAAMFPNLQEVFDYNNDAMTSSASDTIVLATPFRKLLSNVNQNPDYTFEPIKGADVLNTEFECQNTKSHYGADAVARRLGETEFMGDD